MSNSNKVSNMSDKEFDNKMSKIFYNTSFMQAAEEIWDMYDGSMDGGMDGCKQFLAYCKYWNHLFYSRSVKDCLNYWNDVCERNDLFCDCEDGGVWDYFYSNFFFEEINNISKLNYMLISRTYGC